MKTDDADSGPRLTRGQDIAERMLNFCGAALRLTAKLPGSAVGRHVALQLVRSATGAGANYEEARAAESRNDFAHKVGVACKEIREAHFWLQLIFRSGWIREEMPTLIQEAAELTAIFGASIRTARRNQAEQSSR